VDAISKESGVDHPKEGVYKDTAFDATYNCYGIERLVCINSSKVNTFLGNSLDPDQWDFVIVIVNDSEYGGSGGSIAVTSTNEWGIDVMLHETGHNFGLLGDEYDFSPPTCQNTIEPSEPNVTMQIDRGLIKWNVGGGPPTGWVEFNTPIPTTDTALGLPGLYQGARYCTTGLYRPTYNSKMRNVNLPFEQINEEQLIKRIYNWVSPLQSYSPVAETLTLQRGQSQTFQVTMPKPLTHSLSAQWIVDKEYRSEDFQFTLDTARLDPGSHIVEVFVIDGTSKVRNDPTQVLAEAHAWTVTVNPTLFSDVLFGYWAYDYIMDIYNAGLTVGCSQDPLLYCPENYVSREQMAKFILTALKEVPPDGYCGTVNPFTDVPVNRWSCKYVKKLAELGITTGYGDGGFGPGDPVTREQMAVFLVKALGFVPQDGYCGSSDPFTDVAYIRWSCKYVKKFAELGITTGYGDGRYGPLDPVTRAQMAVFLSRAFLGM